MAKKDKKGKGDEEMPIDLAARIGGRPTEPAVPPPPPPPQRVDEAPPGRLDGPLPPRRPLEPRPERPAVIGMDEPAPPPIPIAPDDAEEPKSAAIPSPRLPPGPGEIDLVVTPLPTPDDWHRFEVALRRLRGVALLRPEYYRHGVAKMRVTWEGTERLAQTLRAGIPGFRVRVIGEDRTTLQILVSSENDERRPG